MDDALDQTPVEGEEEDVQGDDLGGAVADDQDLADGNDAVANGMGAGSDDVAADANDDAMGDDLAAGDEEEEDEQL